MESKHLGKVLRATWDLEIPFDCIEVFTEEIQAITNAVNKLRTQITFYESSEYLARAREAIAHVLEMLVMRGELENKATLTVADIYRLYSMHHSQFLQGPSYPLSILKKAFSPLGDEDFTTVAYLIDFPGNDIGS